MRGDTLVILRRGRLFTVSLAGGRMRPVDSINAFPPGVSGQGDWYDEMLISGDRVIVVGYSYARGGTEINRFRLDPAGRLRFEDAWHLKSNDYYSSRNYASRLIGNRLIFYTPLDLDWEDDPFEVLPGVRRWQGGQGAEDRKFRRIARAGQVFIAPAMRRSREAIVDTLHSVTSCDLTAADLGCSATAVLGPPSRTFYVSAQGVYLWVTDAWQSSRPESYLYRLPFGRERPSATAARGVPVDQFSFREDPAEGLINVLVKSDGGGDAMFAPEISGGGGVALLRVRFSDFGDASQQVPRARYRFLPSVPGWSFHNRFAGDYVLYGAGTYGESASRANLIAARLRDGRVTRLPIPHSVDRIELLGRDAMVIGGTPRGLGFSTVELDGGAPRPRRPLRPSRIRPRARAAATLSSSARTRTRPTAPRARSDCPSPSARIRRSPASSEARRRWSSFAASAAGSPRPASSRRRPGAWSTTPARRAASTGTAMPGRSSGAAGPSPCSATSWSRASSPAAGSAKSAGSASRRRPAQRQ